MTQPTQKLRLSALIALVVGSMIGGGIFSLPQNMAARADVGAILIGWAITAIGMLTLAFVFQTLANRKPELDSGVYAYAKAGFGDYMGFSSAWGYWISAWLGNVGYFVLLFSTLGYFFPVFGQGNTPIAIGCASVLLWALRTTTFIFDSMPAAAIVAARMTLGSGVTSTTKAARARAASRGSRASRAARMDTQAPWALEVAGSLAPAPSMPRAGCRVHSSITGRGLI